ncbi:tyrosine-type recombinase/integrase [Halomonas beimenensis]|uniref:Integrase n=1 Tax=Halomonas beimenensis TaxID=475662 RepID=A0A291P2W2_9GAMM|nr:tyrosine-type recombinase/integrase [Halomonas beimenensis]ATJ81221.1 integrase [Halomonas beimenensis]
MTIKKVQNGWRVDLRPHGRYGKRVRKTLKTQAQARRFEQHVLAKAAQGEVFQAPKRDKRRLLDLVELWYQHHGQTLKSSRDRVRSLRKLADALGNPLAEAFTAQDWTEYRTRRLKEVKASTVNHEHAYLKAMFSELERLDLWHKGNPLARMRMVRTEETEMAFLDDSQVRLLLDHLKRQPRRDCYYVTLLCLSTGARWSEAQYLRAENVGKDRVTFVGTKSGKARTVPIDPRLAGELRRRRKIGRLFAGSYKAFGQAIQETGIELPDGQLTHVLRHTFASHFMMNGGNILVLQRILGHQSITMTMRYSHFAPDHLEDAARLNPVVTFMKEC